ncbi:putative F-box protein [Cinnamomum micranthum f. kanehirae]|uniref:Putative F-box protein n=1 Tax=Cinnamomum micranthum f. kanehirae TaxID=337451 RepID=A0A3S3MT35_9MAGN|nr:putative F-box protein [Cinnamomum micranthum f. kanehirae]
MATLQASFNLITSSSSCSSSSSSFHNRVFATLSVPELPNLHLSLPKLQTANMVELEIPNRLKTKTNPQVLRMRTATENKDAIDMAITKLYAIADGVADRVEMHANIGEQRNNWNNLLLNSINAITLTAATMAGLSMIPTGTNFVLVMKITSTLLYSAATALLLVVNKIQPSQLAEEQRNASRLFRQLHEQIRTTLTLGTPTLKDVDEAMEKMLALDKAYPLPLLPGMLDKFPATVEPTRWWPAERKQRQPQQLLSKQKGMNGWNQDLEEEMRGVLGVLKRKDTADYMRLSKLVLKINRILATSGPLLTGLAALGTALAGSSSYGSWAGLVGVAGGALATIVNTFEHGGQVGMVFEMYRNCAGFYRFLEERIESNLIERDFHKRENGEMFEMKMAIELGRSIQELRDLAAASMRYNDKDSSTSEERFVATLRAPKLPKLLHLSLPKIQNTNIKELHISGGMAPTTNTQMQKKWSATENKDAIDMAIIKLYAIAETVADRVEMHANIGEQRNNWNKLLSNSINAIILTAATMAGLSMISTGTNSVWVMKIASTLLYSAATGLLLVVNKIQPSQLAEEQRNASRLFRQLHEQIRTTLAIGTPTLKDADDAMEKMLAVDKAYPLPLLPGMLDKFPDLVEPARWWPSKRPQRQQQQQNIPNQKDMNGWSQDLEEEMRGVLGVLKRKDTADYLRLTKLVLKVNTILAASGPVLTGLAGLGTALAGSSPLGSWAALVGVAGGALASIINTLEHGGQVGMVFELYRNCAGAYRFLEERIESNINERDFQKRENGELFEMKVAIELGRSIQELRDLGAASIAYKDEDSSTSEEAPKLPYVHLSLPKLQTVNMEELDIPNQLKNITNPQVLRMMTATENKDAIDMAITKLYAIAEAAADRVEMHANIGEQRNNWNNLLLNSINAITLTAATMAGLSMIPTGTNFVSVMKITSTLLYSAATALLLVVNKIQPSQLAEEQRNASRLFRQLHEQIRTTLTLGNPTLKDVDEAMEKMLALDKAYPLPLLPGMLDKFPATVEPTRWWPAERKQRRPQQLLSKQEGMNGWNQDLEEEMRGVLGVLKRKDTADYMRLSKLVLKINRILATSGPLLTGLAALGTALAGSSSYGSWAGLVGVAGGALATIVNTFEHGGQVGMVFEMYRNCAGFYRFLEERIESNLIERDFHKRENGEMFEMKMAIELGRSVQELRDLAAASMRYNDKHSSTSEERVFATLRAPKLPNLHLSLPKLQTVNMEELDIPNQLKNITNPQELRMRTASENKDAIDMAITKLYAIAEAVADRVEMHANIGEQRNNWNNLLLNSINAITLTAATMAGLSMIPTGTNFVLVMKITSTLLYSAATALLLVVNKIQPSQLAEEQRNASRLFRQLHEQIRTALTLGTPTLKDVDEAMEKMLALDKAYPLPLLPGMLDKFPATVEPTRWWPAERKQRRPQQLLSQQEGMNGWNQDLEEEMRGVLGVLKRKDTADYMRLSKLVLKINRILATSGPLLTGLAALGTALAGSSSYGSWAGLVGVAGGALATIVNTFEHSGQVGMVFEMYRNCAGFYRFLEERIESNLNERDFHKRENGEMFEMKMAIELGRSIQELRDLAAASMRYNDKDSSTFTSEENMAAFQASLNLITSTSSSSSTSNFDRRVFAILSTPKLPKLLHLSLPKVKTTNMEELHVSGGMAPITNTQMQKTSTATENMDAIDMAIIKLYAIAEAVADRVEMHANIGEQRNNWNNLLSNSINAIILTAATMTGLSMIPTGTSSVWVMKIASTLLYSAATGLLLVVNKIQPSQLAEEQRNASRLFRQLHEQIRTTLALGTPTLKDADDAMEKMLALDKAYPLPLLPGMLDKFPTLVEPTRWWPSKRPQRQQQQQQQKNLSNEMDMNAWSQNLEEEMRGVLGVLKRKDTADYMRLSKLVLKVNRILAASGPILTGLAALGTALGGSSSHGPWAALVGVAGGALASFINTLEHGGQVGMVFEMYRNCAGSYRFLEERIESNLNEGDFQKRENGELFEMKVAIELGRSIQELRDFGFASIACKDEDSSTLEERFVATLSAPKLPKLLHLSLPKIQTTNMEELDIRWGTVPIINTQMQNVRTATENKDAIDMATIKLYAIAEVVADRVEMHANIGEQRNNWNNLLSNSINAITLTAATMAGLSMIPIGTHSIFAMKLASTLLYSAATGLLLVVNKIQPSQLAEEQRNALRLFRQLHEQIRTTLALGTPTLKDVDDAMEKMLALDKAYPLPLLPGMLDKFPSLVEPARWWPSKRPQRQSQQQQKDISHEKEVMNGWSQGLEEEIRGVLGVLKRKDTADYLRLTKLVLKVNRILAGLGPVLTGLAALGTALAGSSAHGSWAALVGVAGGALASIINTLEHGGQVGMVFEMYRNCAGSYRFLEERIESNLNERDLQKRENGELFEMKVAIELGRSIQELRDLGAASIGYKDEDSSTSEEFAGKLF